jgi:hypothetical protein
MPVGDPIRDSWPERPPPVSVLVSVVPVYRRPGASDRLFRERKRRPVDSYGPRFADLESGLGASPRGFESRILRP